MLDTSKDLICHINLWFTVDCQEAARSNCTVQYDPFDRRVRCHLFKGGLQDSDSIAKSDPKKILALLLSKNIIVHAERFYGHSKPDLGVICFSPVDVSQWIDSHRFPHTHLKIEVKRGEWDALNFEDEWKRRNRGM